MKRIIHLILIAMAFASCKEVQKPAVTDETAAVEETLVIPAIKAEYTN